MTITPPYPIGRRQHLAASWMMLLSLIISSCTIDSYEKGEGDYSLMTAEMVEAHVGSDKRVDYVDTDVDEHLLIQPTATANWITTADTTYRALLYYKKTEVGQAKAVSIGYVGVLMPHDSIKGGMKTDPLYAESLWLSKNRSYLNLRLRLMTGTTDDKEAMHTIGLVRDTLASTDKHMCLQLYHDQGGRPEYYSSTAFASIPLTQITADTITLVVNTYSGVVTRTFVTRK
ncbi:MAG: NigD-like N-terminal domain-containing protein [Prevotella sp.]|nr:NigD-like N-terminal domain-containing protein [Prevotella sp.]